MTNIGQYQSILDKVPDVPPEPYDALPVGNIGLCGAHRTGKTTLAIALSEALNMPFVSIGTSEIFKRYHLDPARPMDFRTRLAVQEKILECATDIWAVQDQPFICDRTPIDMAAYTLAEVGGKTLDENLEVRLKNYRKRCRATTEKYFSYLFLIPPAIPIIECESKASPSEGYIEHIHTLCVGSLYNVNCENTKAFVLKSHVVAIGDRISAVKEALNADLVGELGG